MATLAAGRNREIDRKIERWREKQGCDATKNARTES